MFSAKGATGFPCQKCATKTERGKLSLTIFCEGAGMDLPAAYVATTESLLATLTISHQLGHLGGGVILYFGAQYLVGSRRAPLLPLLTVALAELFNEAMQARYYGSWRTADTLADIGWTLFWPCIFFVYGLHRRRQPARAKVRRLLQNRRALPG
jgi:hypothetical protein